MTEMQKVARALNLPVNIVQEAEIIKKQLEQVYPKEELKLIVAVAIILVCKKHKFKLDIAKLSKCIGVGKKDIIKARKRICLKDESSVLQKLRDLFS
jgi:transcription initiation factor TFIIIB Brf1 subunit/transcription initiation factor TFIIB